MAFDITSYIDHTLLKPGTTSAEVAYLCNEAIQYNFAAVCVPPCYVKDAKQHLACTQVVVATVIGFPLGYNTTNAKLEEIRIALEDGADEIDMVQNMGMLKSGNLAYLEKEINHCVAVVHAHSKILKLILETGELTDYELLACCQLYSTTKVDFLKTSTGFSATGATLYAVQLMRANLPATIAIKASGGIRNFTFAKELIDAGATRIGCSAGVQIVKESKEA
jgi:deoxyribose-phosphate aldolase